MNISNLRKSDLCEIISFCDIVIAHLHKTVHTFLCPVIDSSDLLSPNSKKYLKNKINIELSRYAGGYNHFFACALKPITRFDEVNKISRDDDYLRSQTYRIEFLKEIRQFAENRLNRGK